MLLKKGLKKVTISKKYSKKGFHDWVSSKKGFKKWIAQKRKLIFWVLKKVSPKLVSPKGLREPEATLEPRVHECVRHTSELYCSHVTYIGVTLSPLG